MVHPNLICRSLDTYDKKIAKYQCLNQGMYIFVCAGQLLYDDETMKILVQNKMYEWGVFFEHLLIGLVECRSTDMLNLINLCDVYKIENDRKASKKTKKNLMKSWKRNQEVLQRCINKGLIDKRVRAYLKSFHYKW